MFKNYQVFISISLLGCLIILIFAVPNFLVILAYVILGGLGLGLLLGGIWLAARIYLALSKEYWEKEQKKRHVIIAPMGQQVFVETRKDSHFHALHLEQRIYSNGKYEEPLPLEQQAWHHFHRPNKSQQVLIEDMKSANPKPQLLPLLAHTWKIFIVGNEGSGKTTLLKALMGQRLQDGPVIVVDIHGNKDHWPGAKVVGTGYNLEEVILTFDRVVAEIKRRYKLISEDATAASTFQPITILCDEFTGLVGNLSGLDYDLSLFMRVMSTEVRKTKICFIFASHVETLAGTGMTGSAKLLNSFIKVRLFYDAINKDHRYTVDLNDGNGPQEVENILPISAAPIPKPTEPELPQPTIGDLDRKVMDFINGVEEYSKRKLIVKVLGIAPSQIGSQHYTRIDKVIARLNRAGLIQNSN